ncbi:hypothetical protein HWV07_04390 [Natronomonas salina]|uniref:hypothetical protein n=1 Tax=Natronomonas salina TaxID=1710540 RepID=UPI0015B6E55C|nr:hypothetical protein [Natronomonas salina]QLD88312.1 hypothetical protein HWV07_04390 [Natronomonas salina]
MDAEEAVKLGALFALFVFATLWLSTFDFSINSNPDTVENTKKATRFLYAGVMTVAPTSKVAVAIDIGAAIVASIGLVKGAKESVKAGIVGAAFLYFFTGFVVHYVTAPI